MSISLRATAVMLVLSSLSLADASQRVSHFSEVHCYGRNAQAEYWVNGSIGSNSSRPNLRFIKYPILNETHAAGEVIKFKESSKVKVTQQPGGFFEVLGIVTPRFTLHIPVPDAFGRDDGAGGRSTQNFSQISVDGIKQNMFCSIKAQF